MVNADADDGNWTCSAGKLMQSYVVLFIRRAVVNPQGNLLNVFTWYDHFKPHSGEHMPESIASISGTAKLNKKKTTAQVLRRKKPKTNCSRTLVDGKREESQCTFV